MPSASTKKLPRQQQQQQQQQHTSSTPAAAWHRAQHGTAAAQQQHGTVAHVFCMDCINVSRAVATALNHALPPAVTCCHRCHKIWRIVFAAAAPHFLRRKYPRPIACKKHDVIALTSASSAALGSPYERSQRSALLHMIGVAIVLREVGKIGEVLS